LAVVSGDCAAELQSCQQFPAHLQCRPGRIASSFAILGCRIEQTQGPGAWDFGVDFASKMNTKLLLVAYAFPPENVSGAARPFRFYRYLSEFGISPLVVTASAQIQQQPDVVFVRDVPRESPRKTFSWHLERVVRKFLLPGQAGLTWSRDAAAQGCKLITRHDRAAVLSTSPPISVHLAALGIKKRLGIPWIADFRDPMHPSADVVPRKKSIHTFLEAFFFKHADAILANTDVVARLWSLRYPEHREKIHVIWNGFDPDEVISAAPSPERRFKHIVHVGELYAGRHPGPILASIQRLIARGALLPDSLRLSLIGPSTDSAIPDIDLLRQLARAGIVEYVASQIPQDRARLIARQADALLLLQPQSGLHLPAKIFEYIRIGRPILALVRRDSPSEHILSRCGVVHRTIYPDDPPDEIDRKIVEFLALPNEPVAPNKWFAEQFNAHRQTGTLSSIVHSLLRDRSKT
jgi:glycosyltransferase involved in cell wall biosynthesis